MNLQNRVAALKDRSGVVAIHLIDVKEGRITMPEALVRMIEDLVGVNERLIEQINSPVFTDDKTLADAIIDAMFEDDKNYND